MNGFDELAPLYGVPDDTVTVALNGGPLDGEEHRVPVDGRSHHQLMVALLSYWFRLPVEPSLFGPPKELLQWPLPPSQAGYGLMLDVYGQPSRDDTGRLRLEFRGLL